MGPHFTKRMQWGKEADERMDDVTKDGLYDGGMPALEEAKEGMIDLILQLADREFFDPEICALLKNKLGKTEK